jgi:acetyl-CoA carboxylase alpha subunit
MEYLDFELPIKELEDQLDKCQIIGAESNVDVTATCKQIEKKLEETKRKIYKNLTAWQRVQLSRHPNRPYTLEHITNLIVAGAAHVVFARVHRKRLHIHRGLYPQRPIQTPTYKVQRFNHRGRHESEQCRP